MRHFHRQKTIQGVGGYNKIKYLGKISLKSRHVIKGLKELKDEVKSKQRTANTETLESKSPYI